MKIDSNSRICQLRMFPNAESLLDYIKQNGGELSVSGHNVVFRGPGEFFDSGIGESIKYHKSDLMAVLSGYADLDNVIENWRQNPTTENWEQLRNVSELVPAVSRFC